MRVLWGLSVPALLLGSSYFGYYGLYGERGYVKLATVNTELAQAHAHLAQLTSDRLRLQHRIDLLKSGDPDLVEELARTKLMDGAPGQVAVPREREPRAK
ncbi:septum formation initiator family protein [Rhizomicrobium palustre]|uniref:FtsB family cell division protein n=1 Tax=Rhizomicrobium palustre TaxID=189966 RepID=UPI0031DB45F1